MAKFVSPEYCIFLRSINFSNLFCRDFYTFFFKQTVHCSNFEKSTSLLIRLFQTAKVQTKAETIEWNMKWQESNSKGVFYNFCDAQFTLKKCKIHLNKNVMFQIWPIGPLTKK